MNFKDYLFKFKSFNMLKKANNLTFDEFTSFICNKELIQTTNYMVSSLEGELHLDKIINARELITVYTVCAFNNILFEDNNDEAVKNLINIGKELAIYLESDVEDKDYMFQLAQLCIEFKNLFNIWKSGDKDKLIGEIQEAYFKLDASLTLTTLQGEDYEEWKKGVDNVKRILKDNLMIIAGKETVKEMEGMKYDIMMLDDKVQNGIALVMEKAFWDHIITEMNLGNYKSFIGLFSEIKDLFIVLVSNREVFVNQINSSLICQMDKCDLQLIYNNIVFIYEKIKEYGIPDNDSNVDQIINKIHEDFNNIKNLDKNKMMLEYMRSAFILIKDLIQKKDEFLSGNYNNEGTNKENNEDEMNEGTNEDEMNEGTNEDEMNEGTNKDEMNEGTNECGDSDE